MTLFELIQKYFDQPKVGNTPENKGQCVGLVSVAMDELGIPHEWGDAKDLLANANTSYFEIILNSVSLIPTPGDILVYGKNYGGGFGHTAICIFASQMKLVRFEQNNPTGSNPIITTVGYDNNVNGLLGWLHPINGFSTAAVDPAIIQQSDAFIATATELQVQATKDIVISKIKGMFEEISQLQDSNRAKDQQISLDNSQIEEIKKRADDLSKQVSDFSTANMEAQKTIEEFRQQINVLSDQNEKDTNVMANLKTQIEELQKVQPISQYKANELIILGLKKFFSGK